MPLVNIGDLRLNVTMHGRSGRTLVFVHGLRVLEREPSREATSTEAPEHR